MILRGFVPAKSLNQADATSFLFLPPGTCENRHTYSTLYIFWEGGGREEGKKGGKLTSQKLSRDSCPFLFWLSCPHDVRFLASRMRCILEVNWRVQWKLNFAVTVSDMPWLQGTKWQHLHRQNEGDVASLGGQTRPDKDILIRWHTHWAKAKIVTMLTSSLKAGFCLNPSFSVITLNSS